MAFEPKNKFVAENARPLNQTKKTRTKYYLTEKQSQDCEAKIRWRTENLRTENPLTEILRKP